METENDEDDGVPVPRASCSLPFCSVLRINFPRERLAMICKECLEVDEELTDKTAKVFRVEGTCLVVELYAVDLKMLRTALSSFFDMVAVSVKTLLEFDEGDD